MQKILQILNEIHTYQNTTQNIQSSLSDAIKELETMLSSDTEKKGGCMGTPLPQDMYEKLLGLRMGMCSDSTINPESLTDRMSISKNGSVQMRKIKSELAKMCRASERLPKETKHFSIREAGVPE
jgi:hypothetical protein